VSERGWVPERVVGWADRRGARRRLEGQRPTAGILIGAVRKPALLRMMMVLGVSLVAMVALVSASDALAGVVKFGYTGARSSTRCLTGWGRWF
jgi:hypothetical protein